MKKRICASKPFGSFKTKIEYQKVLCFCLCFFTPVVLLPPPLVNSRVAALTEPSPTTWHKLAITDSLTGTYNRNAYDIHIVDNGNGIHKELRGIILFDVDDFKMINDTQGHLAGDALLKDVAKILLEIFREPQYRVFRIGGDEFSVLSIGASEDEIIERLLALKERLAANANISLSKGYSIIQDNPEKAFKYADEMLYTDKMARKLRS